MHSAPSQTDHHATSAPRWYAVRCKPRQEQRAVAHLTNQGFTTYLPHISIDKRHRGRWQRLREVLFPGYLFICVDPSHQSLAPVRSTQGVQDLVRVAGRPVAVNEQIIHQIRAREAALEAQPVAMSRRLIPGELVAIVSGPLAGLDGVFHMAESDKRIQVLVRILGGEKTLSLDMDAVAVG